jgi:hypothetical protein
MTLHDIPREENLGPFLVASLQLDAIAETGRILRMLRIFRRPHRRLRRLSGGIDSGVTTAKRKATRYLHEHSLLADETCGPVVVG